MAGLWELVKQGARPKIKGHLIVGAIKGRQANIEDGTVGFTAAQVLNVINANLVSDGYPVLDSTAEGDLSAINTVLVGLANVNARQTYVNLVEALFIAAELGEIDEIKWRADLGI